MKVIVSFRAGSFNCCCRFDRYGESKAMNCSRCAISGGGGTNCRFVSFVQSRAVIGGSDGVWSRNAQCIPSAPGHFNLWTVPFNRLCWSSR
jgi:hypothetical protein